MHLVQILLPLYDNAGEAFPESCYRDVLHRLTERFGGVTAYTRAPAQGRWKTDGGDVDRDEIVIVEAMVDALDRAWWSRYREQLAGRFRQEALVIRAMAIEAL